MLAVFWAFGFSMGCVLSLKCLKYEPLDVILYVNLNDTYWSPGRRSILRAHGLDGGPREL